jgi:hypothetical protein
MSKEKNTSTLVGQRLRIRIIHEIVLHEAKPTPKGKKAREFLAEQVNKKLKLRGLREITVKTLEADINDINQGLFEEADTTLSLLPNKKLYDLHYDHVDRMYAYHHERIPNISFLDANEEHTVAFLKGILSQYSELPAVQRLMQESPAFFNLDIEKVDTSQVFLIKKPEHQSELRKNSMMDTTLRILEHIKREEVVHFAYVESQKLEHFTGSVPEKSTFRVYPLCLRLHDGFYHLCAVSQLQSKNKRPNKYIVRNFRIDQIDGSSLTKVRDPKLPHTFERFSASEKWVTYNIQKKLAKAIGVWNMPNDAQEEEVIIRFYGWAANHLMIFKVHDSQELVDIKPIENYIDLKFKFHTYSKHRALSKPHQNFHTTGLTNGAWSSEQFPYVALFERYPEAGYLFGKYVNFMHVLTKF